MLDATSWKTYLYGKGWAEALVDAPPATGFDRSVMCSVSGPEPGYVATGRMYCVMARTVRERREALKGGAKGQVELPVVGGVFTPAGLVGSGGIGAVERLVERMRTCCLIPLMSSSYALPSR